MKLKLSQSIFEDLESRAVIHDRSQSEEATPIWSRLAERNWPKNMVFEVTPDDLMDIAYEATWQGWQATDWAYDGDNWALGQITASKFQVQRCLKLMTPAQVETYNTWKTNTQKGWN